jgi:predicted TIM-barrel fold metal-dependent hydrolase
MPVGNVECTPTGQANEEVLRIVKEHSDRFVAFCNIDPRNCYNSPAAQFTEILKHYKSQGCRGVGAVCAKLPIVDLRVQNLFRCCEEARMPIAIRLDGFEDVGSGLYDPPMLFGLKESLAKYSKLMFLVTGAAFWCEISAYRKRDDRVGLPVGPVKEGMLSQLLETYPNLMCDLSGPWGERAMLRDPSYAARFLARFKDRVVFGLGAQSPEDIARALPPLPAFLRKLKDTGAISIDVFNSIAFGNAKRIVGI